MPAKKISLMRTASLYFQQDKPDSLFRADLGDILIARLMSSGVNPRLAISASKFGNISLLLSTVLGCSGIIILPNTVNVKRFFAVFGNFLLAFFRIIWYSLGAEREVRNVLDTLKAMKKACGKTTAEIAKASGIPEPTLTKLFAGVTKNPTLGTMRDVTHAMGYTLDDLERRPGEIENPLTPKGARGTKEWLEDLLVSRGIIKPGEDLTDNQADMLIALVQLIEAWLKSMGE